MNKRGIAIDFTGWLILGVAVLVVVLYLIYQFGAAQSKDVNFISNLFRFS